MRISSTGRSTAEAAGMTSDVVADAGVGVDDDVGGAMFASVLVGTLCGVEAADTAPDPRLVSPELPPCPQLDSIRGKITMAHRHRGSRSAKVINPSRLHVDDFVCQPGSGEPDSWPKI